MSTKRSLRILVVDDMPAMRQIYCDMLEESGFTHVEAAEDADSAWKQIQNQAALSNASYELVIADWNMPGSSGIDLLRSVRNYLPTRELPFLMVTARGGALHLQEALRAGASGFIVKPFQCRELADKSDSLFMGALGS